MRRVCFSFEMLFLFTVTLSVKSVMPELASAVLPPVPPAVEANAEHAKIGEFVKLWKEALEIDGQDPGPAVRLNFEVRTVAAPDNFHMLNAVPQHVRNPLHIRNANFSRLRKEFILDHIFVDAVELNAPSLTAPSGFLTSSFSGKDIALRFDEKLGLVADGVRVTAAMTLQDGTRMLTLDGFLFGARQRINSALDDILGESRSADLDTPLGPPLDLSVSLPQPPAPPPVEELARGSQGFVIQTPSRLVSPPALPSQRVVRPPAPPPGFPAGISVQSQSSSTLGVQPPAPQRGFSSQTHTSARFFPQPPAPPLTLSTQHQASLTSPSLPSPGPATLSLASSGKDLLSSSDGLEQNLEQRLNSFNDQSATAIGEFSSKLDISEGHGQFQQTNSEGFQTVGVPLPTGPVQLGGIDGNTNKLEIGQQLNAFQVSTSPGIPLTSVNTNTGSDHLGDSKFHTQSQIASESGLGAHSQSLSDTNSIPFSVGRLQVDQVGVPLPGLEISTSGIHSNDLQPSNVGPNLLTSISSEDLTLETLDNRLDTVEDILERENLNGALDILRETNFLGQLLDEESGTFLLLAPSNEALARLSDDELDDLKSSDLFSYHIIPLGNMPAPEVTNDSTFTTLLGKLVRFNVYDGKVFVNGQGLVRGDIRVPRGTIQVVDGVLRPPAGDLQTVLEQSEAQVARTAALLTMHGRTLSQDRPITVLAPLDASITSKGFSWPGLLESSEMAGSLLGGLTIEGSWYAEGLTRQRTLTSSVGMNITFRKMADGTITANGVPLIMSDLSAVDGVAHVVADLIPNTDLGSDSNEPQTPILEIIKEGGIKNVPENFSGAQNFLTNSDLSTFKSVVGSNIQARTNPLSTGNFFASGIQNGIPQISGLYQTPVEDNFNFNQPPPVFSPQEPSVTEDGDPNAPSYNIVTPADSVASFVPDLNSPNNEQGTDFPDGQETLFETFSNEGIPNQEDGLGVSPPLDVGVPLPQLPETEVVGSGDPTLDGTVDAGVATLDVGVSFPDTDVDSSQLPQYGADSVTSDKTSTDEYNYGTPLSEGIPLPETNSDTQSPISAYGSESSLGEGENTDPSTFLDVGVPLPEDNSGIQVPAVSFDFDETSPNGGSNGGADFSETDLSGAQIPVNEVNENISPQTGLRPTIADSIAQFDQLGDVDPNGGTVQPAGSLGAEEEYPTSQREVSISAIATSVGTDAESEFSTSGTIPFVPEIASSLPAVTPTSQSNIPTTNIDASTASNAPNFLTLYNTPVLSSAERADPFTSGVPSDLLRVQPSAFSSNTEGLTSQSSARSFSSARTGTRVNNIFITTPEVLPGQSNPFDLSAKTKSNNFNFKSNIPPIEILSDEDDHDSFFVITRGNLNLKDVIDKLDENIRKHIHILDSPSIFFNSSVTELALQKSLPEQLLEEIRLTLNANNMTFGNIGVSSSQDPSIQLNLPQTSNPQAVPVQDDSVGLTSHNSGSPLSVQSEQKSARVHSVARLSSVKFGTASLASHQNFSSHLSSNEIFAPTGSRKTHLASTATQQTQPLQRRQTTTQSPSDNSARFSTTTSRPLNFNSLTDTTLDELEFEGTTTEFFDVETTTFSQKTQKSLEPVSGLINLLSLQQNRKPLQDEKFPVVSVKEDGFAATTPNSFEGTSEQPTELTTDPSNSGFEEEIVNTELPGQNDELTFSTFRPSLAASAGKSKSVVSTSKVTFANQLQRDDSISASHEQEMNVIEFLRQKNLTAFADLLELTGLNRDMIRGGPWTIFAPSNEGIEIVRQSGGLDLSMKDLRHLAAYHVVPRVLTTDMFIEKSRLPTLYAGYTLYMESNDNDKWSVGGGLLTGSSWVHSGPSTWVTHEVDRVLYAPHGNLLTTMALAPALTNFTTLLAANPRIRRMLQGRRPMTVVAPSNAAMARLPPGVQPSSAWLESHIARGFRYSVCFPRHSTVTTLAGSEIRTSTNATNGVVSINEIPASYLDITAANGVLHVVDDLIVTGS